EVARAAGPPLGGRAGAAGADALQQERLQRARAEPWCERTREPEDRARGRRHRDVDLDVGNSGAPPRGGDVAPRDRDRVARAAAEVDRAALPGERYAFQHAALPHGAALVEALDHGGGCPSRDPAARVEREDEVGGGGEARLQVGGEAV